jgi:Fur family ferric uptake transcriptional regulator
VVDLLDGQDCCLSAHEIAGRLHERGDRVGIASVYRTIELLRGAGLLDRLEVGEGGARYEAVVPGGHHHHHLVCENCGRITPFEDADLERAIGRLADRLAHGVSAHDVVIHGHCERCERNRRRQPAGGRGSRAG